MFMIYGSQMCPDCRRCKETFDSQGIEYEFIDINESLMNLKKMFLRLRDSKDLFISYKEKVKIGIPFLMGDNGEEFCDWKKYLADKGIQAIDVVTGQACNIDGKGC